MCYRQGLFFCLSFADSGLADSGHIVYFTGKIGFAQSLHGRYYQFGLHGARAFNSSGLPATAGGIQIFLWPIAVFRFEVYRPKVRR